MLCWGRALAGEKDILEPKVIGKARWSQVGVGLNHVCALNKDDEFIYCMGEGYSGQLGDGGPVGEPSRLTTMTPVVGGKKFIHLSVGDDHTCAIGETENAFCWGSNEFGQLGNGDNVSSSTPLKVFSDVDSWKTISAGTQHTCGTKNGIEAWCWGNNGHQQVNSSPEKSVLTPSKVAGSWRGVTAGDGYTLAVDGTGKGFGWGLNEMIDVDFAYGGMLGDNSSSMCFDPRTEELCPEADNVAAESKNPGASRCIGRFDSSAYGEYCANSGQPPLAEHFRWGACAVRHRAGNGANVLLGLHLGRGVRGRQSTVTRSHTPGGSHRERVLGDRVERHRRFQVWHPEEWAGVLLGSERF